MKNTFWFASLALIAGVTLNTVCVIHTASAQSARSSVKVQGEPISEPERLVFQTQTEAGQFVLRLEPENPPVEIGKLHNWVLRVTDTRGKPVYPAKVIIDGGMAAHGHGLPTAPQVSEYLGNARYLIEGVLFNMAGEWTLRIGVQNADAQDIARVDFALDF